VPQQRKPWGVGARRSFRCGRSCRGSGTGSGGGVGRACGATSTTSSGGTAGISAVSNSSVS
jgi:hypothetical protein